MTGPPLVLHIVGLKKSGKTSLIESLIPELNRLGIKAAALKHDACDHFEWDKGGADTQRIAAAGSPVTGIVSDTAFAVQASGTLSITLPEIVEIFFKGFDILLVEGFKRLKGRKVEVLRKGISIHPVCPEDELVATFGDRLFDRDAPHFTHHSVGALAELLSRMLSAQPPSRPIKEQS